MLPGDCKKKDIKGRATFSTLYNWHKIQTNNLPHSPIVNSLSLPFNPIMCKSTSNQSVLDGLFLNEYKYVTNNGEQWADVR